MIPTCGACGSSLVLPVLDLGSSPLADRFVKAGEANPVYPLRMGVCRRCWTAQLLDNVPDGPLFGADYGFMTGASPASIEYFRHFANWAMELYQPGRKLVVEIGCNDGTLLKHFDDWGCRTVGIDPADPAVEAARAKSLRVHQELFTHDLGGDMADEYGPAHLVIGTNVIAHTRDPLDFLKGVRTMLADDGFAIFEFQLLDDLVAEGQFDHVYHEHRFFFSLRSLARVAKKAGLSVLYWVHTSAQGGSLRVTFGRRRTEIPSDGTWLERESAYALMQVRAERVKDRLLTLLSEFDVVAGYAASAKATTLLNFCGITSKQVAYVVDTTPGKFGMVMPGTDIPIIQQREGAMSLADAYLILARNYLSSIIRRDYRYLSNGGKFIVPIPTPVVI
jgi:SAM-dependent methyltransferase